MCNVVGRRLHAMTRPLPAAVGPQAQGFTIAATEIRQWLDRASVATLYIEKGSPYN